MPSGKASKRARQTPRPPVRQPAGARARQASPRVLIGAAAGVVVVVVGVVLAITLTGGGGSKTPTDVPAVGSLALGLSGAGDVNTMLTGIPQSGTVLGKASAPVTLTEFIDAQCPYCQEFETQVLPSLIATYVRTGKVKLKMEPWAFIGPDSIKGQAAELAAAQQDKLFNFAAVLYDNQGEENTGWLTDDMITSIAASVPGLRVPALLAARSSSTVKGLQAEVDATAKAYDVSGTPTLYVGKSGTKGKEVTLSSSTDKASVVAALNAAL